MQNQRVISRKWCLFIMTAITFVIVQLSVLANQSKSLEPMTETALLNVTYVIDHHQAQLCDGKAWHSGANAKESWDILTGPVAIGDLDGDGKADGAIVLMLESKTGGPMLHLEVVINSNGKLKQVGDIMLGNNRYLQVESIAIDSGLIFLSVRDHKPTDKIWESTVPVVCGFKLSGGQVVKLTPLISLGAGSALILKPESLTVTDTAGSASSTIHYESLGPDIIATNLLSMKKQAVKEVTKELADNAIYHIEGQTIQLKNGSAAGKTGEEDGNWSASITDMAFGDLNNDGQTDAAAILSLNGGGTGSFYHLVPIIINNGQLTQAGDIELGDRIIVNSLKISSGIITADLTVHGPKDAMVNPTQHVIWQFSFSHGKLIKRV